MHKIATFTVWISIVFASVVALNIFVAIDETQPAGTTGAFKVVAVNTGTKAGAIESLASIADELNCNIFKVHPDPRDSIQGRILFAFVGNAAAFEAHGGFDYPTFSALAMSTRIAMSDSIDTEDLRGRYVTTASIDQMASLLKTLDEAGLTVKDDTINEIEILIYAVATGNLAGSFVVLAVALTLAISYSVSRNRKIYAIKALHGYRRIGNVRTEITAATMAFAVGLSGLLLIGLPLLALYNDFRQASRFFGVLAFTLAILYLAIVALVLLALMVLPRINIPIVLKGEQASKLHSALAALTLLATLAIVVSTTSAAMNRIEAIGDSLSISNHWTDGDDLFALRLTTSGTHEDDLRDAPGLAAVITTMEQSNQVLFVGYKEDTLDQGPGEPGDPEDINSIFVNNEYLNRQVINDANGQRIANLPSGKDHFTLLIPQNYGGDPAALLQSYVEYFRDFGCISGRPEGSFACDPTGSIVFTEPRQDVFSYNGTAFLPVEMQARTLLADPVIAVVSAESELISPMEYLSYVSRDDVLFTDPVRLADALSEQGIAGSFMGIDNASDAVATSVSLAQQELRMDAFALMLGCAVLVLSSTIMAAVYCDRRKRPMFVEVIHGFTFMARHWRYLASIVGLSLLGVGIAVAAGGTSIAGRDLASAAAFIAAQLTITLVAIRVYEKRFRADFIKQN